MVQIIPAILATSDQAYAEDISRLRDLPFKSGWVHIDFADKIFVQNKTIRPSVVPKYPVDFKKEAHLMVVHPWAWIDNLIEAGFERIIFHIEAEDKPKECIENIKLKGLEVGLAVNSQTPIEDLEPFVDKVDVVSVMGVIPGFQGQKFIPETIDKIKQTYSWRSKGNYRFRIGVDGAVKDDNIKAVVTAGVDFVVVGSYLLKGDIEENLENLWEAISGA